MTDRPGSFSEDALLDYVRGSASAALSVQIEDAMADDPALRAEIALMRGLKPALSTDDGVNAPGEFGWRKLEAEIRRETSVEQPAPVRGRASYWRMAAAVFGFAAFGQAAYIATAPQPASEVGYQTASGASEVHVLAVAFTAEATVGEISAFLREAGGRLTDGPSALGFYRVTFSSAEALDAGRVLFDGSALIELIAEE